MYVEEELKNDFLNSVIDYITDDDLISYGEFLLILDDLHTLHQLTQEDIIKLKEIARRRGFFNMV